MLTAFVRDFRHAFRLILKSPLALGIGLNGAIFTFVDALLLRPLPVKKPEELVRLVQVIQNLGPRGYYAYDAVEALEKKSTSFSEIIAYEDENAALRDASGSAGFAARSSAEIFLQRWVCSRCMGACLVPRTRSCQIRRRP